MTTPTYELHPVVTEHDRYTFCSIAQQAPASTVTTEQVEQMQGFPMILLHKGQPVATASLTEWNRKGVGLFVLGHVSSDAADRGKGYEGVMVTMMERFAHEKGMKAVMVTADPYGVSFYEGRGFKPMAWDEDKLASLPSGHVQLVKVLPAPSAAPAYRAKGLTLG